MGKSAGRLTVGSLVGKQPPSAYNATPLRVARGEPPREKKSAPAPCCGSGCAGCPYFSGFTASATA